ncbi:MAG TPA: hypothetical protein VD962_03950, partial [Rubricoccaceae bacterium]|nr:hypothetical protein [Rubricoccaceae bacterium]
MLRLPLLILMLVPALGHAQPVAFSREDTLEAELAALWLSGELRPPRDLSDSLLMVFGAARRALQAEPRCAALASERFSPPWVAGEVSLL